MRAANSNKSGFNDHGLALVIVLMVLLLLTVLVGAIILLARTESMASYNYRLNTQADFLAKAGIQEASNWLRSTRYQAVSQDEAGGFYNVSSTGSPYDLWTNDTSPVQCLSAANCPSPNKQVQLIGIAGTGTSNYPLSNVATNFASDMSNFRISGDETNSGTVSINAVLIGYMTVNITTSSGISAMPVETWRVTSRANWTGTSGSGKTIATVEEVAVVQPIYIPSWGNSLYGYCSVSMQGSSGVCTDSFNSDLGAYGGGNPTVASGGCDSNSLNVIKAGAGVGANGSVTVGSNVTVSGNVAIGAGPTLGCPAPYGFIGDTSSVLGEVMQGNHVDPPDPPTFRTSFPAGAPSFALGVNNVTVLPAGPSWPSIPPFPNKNYSAPLSVHSPCMNNDGTCDGTSSHPYEIGSISMIGGGNGTNAPVLEFIGGPDAFHPIYYDIDSLTQNQGSIQVSGYVVLNIKSSMNIGGQGVSNGTTCSPGPCTSVPPAAVSVSAACTGPCITLGGNGAVGMVLSAPNADVTIGGGGSKGYFVGSAKANNLVVQGGYPVHYDVQLDRANGSVGQMVTTGYTRRRL
jgi:Tfp pilus assembly protein PilX